MRCRQCRHPSACFTTSPTLSELFIDALLPTATLAYEADLVDQLFNSSEKRLGEDTFADGQFWQRGQARARDS